MAIASMIAFVLFIVIEVLRIFQIQPFGKTLNQVLDVFRDKQDQGPLLLTPIYLLLGLSAPLWLSFNYKHSNVLHPLLPFSGIVSLGLGDTSAAVFGKLYGHTPWPGSQKTYIGSMACLLSQILAWFTLMMVFETPFTVYSIVCIMTVSTLVTIAEALTLQIDNLLLPILTYTLLLILT